MTLRVTASRIAVGLATLLAVTAGCSADVTPQAGPSASAPAISAAPPSADATHTPGAACPVSTDVLYQALQANPALLSEIDPSISGLTGPVCVLDWAGAYTVVKNADPMLVVFRYNPVGGTWGAMKAGTSGACNVHGMPEEVKTQLPASCRG